MTTPERVAQIDLAIGYLRVARKLLRGARAPRAADYVARALKSAEGARRHARLAPYRPSPKGVKP